MSQAEVLRKAIEKAGSGRALAQMLKQRETAISNWKAGRPIPDDVLAYLAEYVGQNPLQVLASEKGGMWEKLRAVSAAGLVAATCAALVLGLPQSAEAASPSAERNMLDVYYVKWIRVLLRQCYRFNLLRLRSIWPHQPQRVSTSSAAFTAA